MSWRWRRMWRNKWRISYCDHLVRNVNAKWRMTTNSIRRNVAVTVIMAAQNIFGGHGGVMAGRRRRKQTTKLS